MKTYIHYILLFVLLISASLQAQKKIDVENDRFKRNEQKYPGALIFSKVEKQVHFTHEGIDVWCDNALFYEEENFFRAFGNVKMKQGDTITLNSKYAEYDGETQFAFASNNVRLTTPSNTLTTDSLFFDRQKQEAFYRSGGTVRDTASMITSTIGRYFMQRQKYSFINEVVVTNQQYKINSNHLDYYTETGHAFLYGPSTISSDKSKIYCERGFYDTRLDKGYFVKNSTVYYENRKLEGDSIFFDRNKSFASATNNIKVTDTANQSVLSGHYAEVFRERDSLFITKRAMAAMKQGKDSIFVHSDTLMITGKTKNRVIRGFYNTRMYKSTMSGKSDSVYVSEKTGVTKMLGNPVVWSGRSQLTGDTIHLLNNPKTDKLDSLKVFDHAFMIQQDSIEGFNQVKGKEMFALFDDDNEITEANFIKNTETIYYARDEQMNLIGIDKMVSATIKIIFNDRQITDTYYNNQAEGQMLLPENFPENARRLRGFNWRGKEQLHQKSDLFKGDPPLDLPKIKGIPLPEEESNFFDERPDTDPPLLNEKSNLNQNQLQHRKSDSLPTNTKPEEKSLPLNKNTTD